MNKTNYEQVRKQMNELENQAKNIGKEYFQEMCKELFDTYSALQSFSFSAYTCHFNDGDELFYSVNYENPSINGVRGYVCNYGNDKYFDFEQEDHEETKFLGFASKEELYQCSQRISEILSELDTEDMKRIFGDHTIVTINRNSKIEQEDFYDHD